LFLQKFSKEVLFGPNGKPLYAFYARNGDGNSAAALAMQKGGGSQVARQSDNAGLSRAGLSATDKEIERKVLFKLLREEEQESSHLRQQQLEEKSAGVRTAGSWASILLVSFAALCAPLLFLH